MIRGYSSFLGTCQYLQDRLYALGTPPPDHGGSYPNFPSALNGRWLLADIQQAIFQFTKEDHFIVRDRRLVKARYITDYIVWLQFDDNTSGQVDLYSLLGWGVFEPVKELDDYFRLFRVDKGLGTLIWPNGSVIAPESLFDKARDIT